MSRTCSDCGAAREHEFWARCNTCQSFACERAFAKLQASCGDEFALQLVDACHELARDFHKRASTEEPAK